MFYACLMQIIKKIPQSLDEKAIAYDRLIFYALKAMTLPENGPIRTSVQFLSHFVMQSRNYAQMTQAVLASGEDILRRAIVCVVCVTPRQQVEKFADIFLAINKKYPAEMAVWLKNISHNTTFPTPLIGDAEKLKFFTQILRYYAKRKWCNCCFLN